MKRDGATTSLWQTTSGTIHPAEFPASNLFDAVVIGAGITGMTTALQLQKSGLSCIVIDAANVAFGTSGGTTAHLNTFFDAPYNEVINDFGTEQATLFASGGKDAIALVRNNASEYNISCGFSELPGYVFSIAEDQNKRLDKLVEGAQAVGVKMDYINDSPFPIPYLKIAVVEAQAQINPTEYIYGLANAFETLGGKIIENCRAEKIDEDEILTIHTSQGMLRARHAVYATHVPPGVNILHFRNAPYRSYVLAVTLKDNNYPKALGYDLAEPYHYYRTQEVNGKQYLIAGGEDHKTGHEENTEQRFRNLESYVRKYYNVDEVAFRWSSQYFESADGLPYIGHLPGNRENIYCATGFNGNGITLGTLSGIVLSELIATGDSKYKELFKPSRMKPVAGFMNFVKEGADVVAHFIGDKINTEKLSSIVELAAGEAKVVKYDGHVLAMYKDESHNIHAVNSACTHVKCTVGWNNVEKTWDCPCHGSRFSVDGVMLTGPARKDLEKIAIRNS